MSLPTPWELKKAAAVAKRKPCPECKQPYSDRYKRPFHLMSCSRNPLNHHPSRKQIDDTKTERESAEFASREIGQEYAGEFE